MPIAGVIVDVDGTRIKKGTWLLAVRVVDDGLWSQIKTGALTGYSIGGTALRNPERERATSHA